MERFIKVTKAKLVVVCLAIILPILIITILPPVLEEYFKVYYDIVALRYIIFVALELVIVFKIVHYVRIIKSETYAENAYVKLHDERLVFVKMKACLLALKIILYALAVFTVAFGFYDRGIFYTLLSVLIACVTTLCCTWIYYNNKY